MTEPQSWAEFLPSVDVSGAIPVTFDLGDLTVEGETCYVAMVVPHIHDPDLTVRVGGIHDLPAWTDPRAAAEWVRDRVLWLYRHEALEQIRIDGVAVFEPVGEHPWEVS